MPQVLIAGTVVSRPKADLFPEQGNPRVIFSVRVKDCEIYRIVAYDMRIPEAEILAAGDALSVMGELVLNSRHAISHIVASQINPLRRRSVNRLPISLVR